MAGGAVGCGVIVKFVKFCISSYASFEFYVKEDKGEFAKNLNDFLQAFEEYGGYLKTAWNWLTWAFAEAKKGWDSTLLILLALVSIAVPSSHSAPQFSFSSSSSCSP